MRALHLIKTSVGAAWAVQQIRVLRELGAEIHVALPGPGPRVSQYEAAGARVHYLQTDLAQLVAARSWWRARKALRELVAAIRPDLIHSHFVGSTLTMRLALGRRAALPRLFQVPGPLHLEHRLPRAVELRSAGPSDHWIASCSMVRDLYLRMGVPPGRVFLSHYGTDPSRLCRSDASALRRRLQPTPGSALVGMVAYIYPPKRWLGQRRGLKGHEDLIDAVAILRRKGLDVAAVFVGGAWNGGTAYQAAVERYGRERLGDRALFLGTRTDVADLYSALDVAVHPSHSENLGGALESLLLEVPTIATDVGGLPDLVREPETGWLVPPRSPERLARAIEQALDDPAEARRRAAAGAARARAVADVRRTGAEVMGIYRKILGLDAGRALGKAA